MVQRKMRRGQGPRRVFTQPKELYAVAEGAWRDRDKGAG